MENEQMVVRSESLSLKQVTDRVNLVHEVLKKVMKKGTHFGTVPGCGDKMVLLKPGADVLAMTFRLVPRFEVITANLPNDHREFTVTCSMYSPEGTLLGQGVGSASTMEKKYRYRKDTHGNRIENEDIADVYNTVLKIAKKRAHIDATLTVTAAADLFTQDLIDDDDAPPRKPVTMPTETKTNAALGNTKTVTGEIDAVSVKSSAPDAPKPWKKYGIKIGETWYSTFDEKIGVTGVKGTVATIVYKTNDKGYHDIVTMQPAKPPVLALGGSDDGPPQGEPATATEAKVGNEQSAEPSTVDKLFIAWEELGGSAGQLISILRREKFIGAYEGLNHLKDEQASILLKTVGTLYRNAAESKAKK